MNQRNFKVAFSLMLPVLLNCSANTNLLQKISSHEFALGTVLINTKNRSVTIPAEFNMREGLVEYLLVHETGKVHESLLKTAASPLQIHLAILMLTGGATNLLNSNILSSVLIQATNDVAISATSLIKDRRKEISMQTNSFHYRGSRSVNGTFLAERDGSIIAVIGDPDALMDNRFSSPQDDENWSIQTNAPTIGTKAMVVLNFASPEL
ncbi:MAG: YdjY domain-containing protein [Verrucomicrobiota bacterium]|nr:YdjY domain-containing protein [Verrucomicrobiota bacterium]